MKREIKGEREVQVRQAVIDWLFCLCGAAAVFSCKTTGYLVERRRFRLRLHPHWLHTTLLKVLTCFPVLCF